jgi:glucosamine kinase
MTIIGVSGSTKCDWAILSTGKDIIRLSTAGINPIFHGTESIIDIIQSSSQLLEYKRDAVAVFVYSAGASSRQRQNVIRNALSSVFPKAHHIVNHDIVASALATYNGKPVIAAILGTGSNSCYYDGDIVRQQIPALDYVLGDEGGGAYFGKQLLRDYMYLKLPKDIHAAFEEKHKLTRDEILENVYMKPYANIDRASFMSFIEAHKSHPYISEMIRDGFNRFFEVFITSFSKYREIPIHFTGSVAFHFSDLLNATAEEFGVTIKSIIKEPIEGLIDYHQHKIETA